jgi:hypothetical protein
MYGLGQNIVLSGYSLFYYRDLFFIAHVLIVEVVKGVVVELQIGH